MKKLLFFIMVLILQPNQVLTQTQKELQKQKAIQKVMEATNVEKLKKKSIQFKNKYYANKKEAIKWAKKNGLLIRKTYPGGKTIELQGFQKGRPIYYTTRNIVAAKTVSTNKLQPGGSTGLNLQGEGRTIGIWDAGIAYRGHTSFKDASGQYRVHDMDDSTNIIDDHATHVAGTMAADGDNSNARGMAEKAHIHSYDFNNDISEMIDAAIVASNPLILSNHSYGPEGGWDEDGETWYGDPNSTIETRFGKYDSTAQDLDGLIMDAPYYIVVWAAGNDRGSGPESGASHHHIGSGNQTFTDVHEKDGGDDGFDCIISQGLAKNVITVGAVDDIPNGYNNYSDVKQVNTFFSSSGPTDDGRIKPDIVANGDNLYSTVYHQNMDTTKPTGNYFYSANGTSMAAPNVTGSIALLQEHYRNTHNYDLPRAATMKGLIIHTADEAGNTVGPDYKFGWGLLNTARAAELITSDENSTNKIQELVLDDSPSYSLQVFTDGTKPLKVTIAWTDPAPSSLMSSKMLVNDLDLRLSNGSTFYPWVLDGGLPANAATTGDNKKDNVEQVYIANPVAGYYTITVTHKGTLSSSQHFSMIISGDTSPEATVNILQVDANDNSFGQAAYWNSSAWDYVNPTQDVTLSIEDNYFLASQEFKPSTTQKFNLWQVDGVTDYYKNFSAIPVYAATDEIKAKFDNAYNATVQNALEGFTQSSGGSIKFSDPWLVDANDPQKGNYNQGVNAPLKSVTSPLSLSTGSSYKGVLLDQDYNSQPAYYKVETTTPQTIYVQGKNRQFYFQNWAASPSGSATFKNSNNLETPVVFNNANATVKAVMKGTGLSNSLAAYKSGSQNKIVKAYGTLCSVYESMDKVWLETSDDNGQTWEISNGGKPLNGNTQAKNPSIATIPGTPDIAIVFQENNYGNKIRIMIINPVLPPSNNNFLLYDGIVKVLSGNYSDNATPVIAVEDISNYNSELYIIVWREVSGSATGGLYYRKLKRNSSGSYYFVGNSVKINNTDVDSKNPTITVRQSVTSSSNDFHLAWEEEEDPTDIRIRYYRIHRTGTTDLSFNNYAVASNGSGYPMNIKPSILVSNYNTALILWVGVSLNGHYYDRVVHRSRYNSGNWSSTFTKLGSYVEMVNGNTSDAHNKIVYSWVEDNTYPVNKFRATDVSGTQLLNILTINWFSEKRFTKIEKPLLIV